MEEMIAEGYQDSKTLRNRISAVDEWLEKPDLMAADSNAEYAAVIEIDLAEIREPIIACPNDPDDVKLLSEVAGTRIDDVFIGSCMEHIGHFRAVAEIWRDRKANRNVRTWVSTPTRMDQQKLREEGLFSVFGAIGARVEIPGCSLCMGNQARVPDGAHVFSTSTRNFDNRMGDGARVYLGSAEVAAVTAIIGRVPTLSEYLDVYMERIEPFRGEIYRYLQFDEMDSVK
jgi:aconitate hydratase 2/2-methylisocitrate dehydratase